MVLHRPSDAPVALVSSQVLCVPRPQSHEMKYHAPSVTEVEPIPMAPEGPHRPPVAESGHREKMYIPIHRRNRKESPRDHGEEDTRKASYEHTVF